MARNYKKLLLVSSLLTVFSLVACQVQNPVEDSSFVEEIINFEKIDTVRKEGYLLASNEERTIQINKDIGDMNYLKLVITTDVNIYGNFHYSNVADEGEKAKESFFVEAKEQQQELYHFLDAYRPEYNNHVNCSASSGAHSFYNIPMRTKMACGLFNKTLDSITIKNVSSTEGNVVIDGLYISDRDLPNEEIYLTKGSIKIGSDLMGGGTFTYLERINYKTNKGTYYIDEVLTPDNDVFIGVNAASLVGEEGILGSEDHHVNLINYYDSGRQFQQSFYSAVGGSSTATHGENGYTRKMFYTGNNSGQYWPYNPVQGGDCHCNISQIVDYHISKDTIYVKSKPLDWADNNYVTDSYMENWYTIKNNCIYVKNRFINYAGFSDMDQCGKIQLELPAAYIVHPFNNYVTYQGDSPWTDDQAGLTFRSNLGPWNVRADIVNKHLEDWFAWLNSDGFGVGVYIPDISFYASGRASSSINVSFRGNQDAYSSPMGNADLLKYNKKEAAYSFQSCYTTNTCYTAPEILTTMLDYLPFEYSYVLSVDYLPVIRNNFKNIYFNNEVDNDSMFIWEREMAKKS